MILHLMDEKFLDSTTMALCEIPGRNPGMPIMGSPQRKISDYFHTPVPHYKKLNIRFRIRRT
jgi:hypothetical protein